MLNEHKLLQDCYCASSEKLIKQIWEVELPEVFSEHSVDTLCCYCELWCKSGVLKLWPTGQILPRRALNPSCRYLQPPAPPNPSVGWGRNTRATDVTSCHLIHWPASIAPKHMPGQGWNQTIVRSPSNYSLAPNRAWGTVNQSPVKKVWGPLMQVVISCQTKSSNSILMQTLG